MGNAGTGSVWDFGTPWHTMYTCHRITGSHCCTMSPISFSFCLHCFSLILLCHNQIWCYQLHVQHYCLPPCSTLTPNSIPHQQQSKSQFYVLKTNQSFISRLIVHGLKASKGLLEQGGHWEWGLVRVIATTSFTISWQLPHKHCV